MAVIKVENIYKSFKVYHDIGRTLKEKLLFRERNYYEERRVLQDVSFDINKGEVVALIGSNGSGKSTLLKIINKIIYPKSGQIKTNGRISSLIELGAGFHPDMSGMENIYTNASIFGLSKKAVDERLEEIISFSELGDYIHNPVRTYSSGMFMRLAFSVAINVDADILLIDEILAVGDAAFQTKCFNKLMDLKQQGVTIVIVSHDTGSIERLCDRAIWLCDGKVRKDGDVRSTIFEYLDYLMNSERDGTMLGQAAQREASGHGTPSVQNTEITEVSNSPNNSDSDNSEAISSVEEPETVKRWGNKQIAIQKIYLLDKDNKVITKFQSGAHVKIAVDFIKKADIEEFTVGIGIIRNDNVQAYGSNTLIDKVKLQHKSKEKGTILLDLPNAGLLQGKYMLDVAFVDMDNKPLDYFCECFTFEVNSIIRDVGVIRLQHTWVLDGETLK